MTTTNSVTKLESSLRSAHMTGSDPSVGYNRFPVRCSAFISTFRHYQRISLARGWFYQEVSVMPLCEWPMKEDILKQQFPWRGKNQLPLTCPVCHPFMPSKGKLFGAGSGLSNNVREMSPIKHKKWSNVGGLAFTGQSLITLNESDKNIHKSSKFDKKMLSINLKEKNVEDNQAKICDVSGQECEENFGQIENVKSLMAERWHYTKKTDQILKYYLTKEEDELKHFYLNEKPKRPKSVRIPTSII